MTLAKRFAGPLAPRHFLPDQSEIAFASPDNNNI